MIRFLLAGGWTVVFLILSLPVLFAVWLIGFISPKAKSMASFRIISWAFRVLLFFTGAKIEFIGEDRIPTDRPVLFCPNHRSIFDVIIAYSRATKPTCFVSKKEMNKVPIFNIWMKFILCEFLDRSNLRQGLAVIKRCILLINSGTSVYIFPEGTRNKGTNDMLPFHEGSFKIAEKSGCPIVPVSISNTEDIFEGHLPRVKPAHVIVEFCAPVETEGLTRDEMKAIPSKVRNTILATYTKNKSLI